MKRALRRNRRDLVAPLVLAVAALAVLAYMLLQIPSFKPPGLVRDEDRNRFRFKAQFTSAAGVIADRAQPVAIAGVTVGQVTDAAVDDGRAVLTLSIRDRYTPVYRDATILLRPRTPLKDMYLALDPGTPAAGLLRAGATLPASQTQPDVNFDEILANLDADTRDYLITLLGSAGQALRDPPEAPGGAGRPSPRAVEDLRADFKHFVPLSRSMRRVFGALSRRRESLRSLVHDYERVQAAIAGVDRDLSALIASSAQTFRATASRDAQLRAALAELPGALDAADGALGGVTTMARRSRTTLNALRPFARNLGPALHATRPLAERTTSVLRDRLRPFSRRVRPVAATLKPAAEDLAEAAPALRTAVAVLNRFFDALAYNPPGDEEGYLFWAAWLTHAGPSLLTAQDAEGAMPRALLLASCSQLEAIHQVELGNPSLGPILRILGLPDREQHCAQPARSVATR